MRTTWGHYVRTWAVIAVAALGFGWTVGHLTQPAAVEVASAEPAPELMDTVPAPVQVVAEAPRSMEPLSVAEVQKVVVNEVSAPEVAAPPVEVRKEVAKGGRKSASKGRSPERHQGRRTRSRAPAPENASCQDGVLGCWLTAGNAEIAPPVRGRKKQRS